MSTPKIAVIGAGPAGCMLARLLLLGNISATVFEGEASLDVRSQGGTLDLHEKSGLAVIRAAGLYNEYLKYARYDGAALGICDKNAKFYIHFGASSHGNPEIDRSELRSLLTRSLPEGTVKWNHRLLKVDDDLTLHFESGETATGFDLIVGADGAWSRTRSFLTDEKPFFAGIAGNMLSIPDPAKSAPAVSKFINRGSIFAHSDGKSISGQQMGDGTIHCSAWVRQEKDPRGVDARTATKETILKDFNDWADELVDIIRAADENVKPHSLYMLPVGYRWQHKAGVTILGDAAHLMTPFAGEGVNLAFEDAKSLASAIIGKSKDAKSSLDKRVTKFEEDMFVRAKRAQEMTNGMMRAMFFTVGAPRSSIESYVLKRLSYGIPPSQLRFWRPLLAAGIYTFYFFFKLFR
jgi:2-polyprenyl-6-methoxyphenol hydroxylase-like FAD-dependent oxidoreductase